MSIQAHSSVVLWLTGGRPGATVLRRKYDCNRIERVFTENCKQIVKYNTRSCITRLAVGPSSETRPVKLRRRLRTDDRSCEILPKKTKELGENVLADVHGAITGIVEKHCLRHIAENGKNQTISNNFFTR